jgi:hypothetical protein
MAAASSSVTASNRSRRVSGARQMGHTLADDASTISWMQSLQKR